MEYGLAALTGLMTFISPCVLPMLPVFVTYFAAGEASKRRTLINATGFGLGVMIILMAIGALFAGVAYAFSSFLVDYAWVVNLVTGGIVIIMGLAFMGIIKIPFLTGSSNFNVKTESMRFFSAVLFGLLYAISFGPCATTIGSFTIMSAVKEAILYDGFFKAAMLQLIYSGTIALLFVVSAMLIDQLKGIFNFIKNHYRVFNLVSGIILIILGILMATGLMTKMTNALSMFEPLLVVQHYLS